MPMYGFTPTISDDHLLIGRYSPSKTCKQFYILPVANITAPMYQNHNSDAPTKWTELARPTHWFTDLIPNTSLPVVVGGDDITGTMLTADVKIYDKSNKSWKKIGSLSSARSRVAVAAVYNNAIVVIGGCTKGDTIANLKSSNLSVVELGQVELLC